MPYLKRRQQITSALQKIRPSAPTQVWDTNAWDCVIGFAFESAPLCCAFPRGASDAVPRREGDSVSTFGFVEGIQRGASPFLVASGCQNGLISLCDLRCGQTQHVIQAHSGTALLFEISKRPSCLLVPVHYTPVVSARRGNAVFPSAGSVLSLTWRPHSNYELFSASSDR